MTPTEHGSRAPTRELFFAADNAAYDAARQVVAVFPDLARSVLEVRGSRAIQVLNGLVTNAVEPVPSGRGCYTFMLGPKGRTIAEFRVLPVPGFRAREIEDEVLWMDTPSSAVEAILTHFQKYVPPIFAEYALLDVRRLSCLGPQAGACVGAVLEARGLTVDGPLEDLAPLQAISIGPDGLLVRREAAQVQGFDIYARADQAAELAADLEAAAAELGGATGDGPTWEVLRVERGIPVYGSELSADRLAQEAGQDERAISFEKGCFTGQEVVARIHYRGHVNRLLRGLRVPESGAQTISPGVELAREGRKVGIVCTVAESPRFGTIALAYVRREIDPGDHVGVAGNSETQLEVTSLPFTET